MFGLPPSGFSVDWGVPYLVNWLADTDEVGTTFNVTLPTDRSARDVCLIISQTFDGDNIVTPDNGFQTLVLDVGSNANAQYYWKTLDGTEPDIMNWVYSDAPTVRPFVYTVAIIRNVYEVPRGNDGIVSGALQTSTSTVNPPSTDYRLDDDRGLFVGRFSIVLAWAVSNRAHNFYPQNMGPEGEANAFIDAVIDIGIQQSARGRVRGTFDPNSFGIQGSTGQGRGITAQVY